MKVILIALEEESAVFIETFKNYGLEIIQDLSTPCCTYSILDKDTIIALTGVGKSSTISSILYLNDYYSIDTVYNVGTVGARGIYKIGDIVNIDKVYDGDFDLSEFGYDKYVSPDFPAYIPLLTFDNCNDIHKGPCYTISRFLTEPLSDAESSYVVDMELHSLSLICECLKIPYYSLKVVTDNTEDSVNEHTNNLESCMQKLSKYILDNNILEI